jgi:hypothetical protein
MSGSGDLTSAKKGEFLELRGGKEGSFLVCIKDILNQWCWVRHWLPERREKNSQGATTTKKPPRKLAG